ncbi:MAG: MarR family winged helix-turn-helix transcriptional regulator [Tannerellaceae bacterium]|jgi:DNA-binding MarR family transcriptional regulator|nr:MarR family winged helix-turn-helix transcriptional regulator [Tannerellaceae bacterium]
MSEEKNFPFTCKDLTKDTGFLMLQVSNLWATSHDRVLKRQYDLTHMQYAVLASIYWLVLYGEEVTQVRLAQHTKINAMTISKMLKGLEIKGYVYRTTHSVDVRAKSVHLTGKGKEILDKAIKTIADVDTKFFNSLGKHIDSFNGHMFDLLKENDYIVYD